MAHVCTLNLRQAVLDGEIDSFTDVAKSSGSLWLTLEGSMWAEGLGFSV